MHLPGKAVLTGSPIAWLLLRDGLIVRPHALAWQARLLPRLQRLYFGNQDFLQRATHLPDGIRATSARISLRSSGSWEDARTPLLLEGGNRLQARRFEHTLVDKGRKEGVNVEKPEIWFTIAVQKPSTRALLCVLLLSSCEGNTVC